MIQPDDFDLFGNRTIELDGFKIVINVTQSEDWPDYLGRFSRVKTEGAVDHHKFSKYRDKSAKRWFIAQPTYPERVELFLLDASLPSEAEEKARDGVMRDYRRMDAFEHEWWLLNIRAQAWRKDVLLGEVEIHGIESDDPDPDGLMDDLVGEVIAKANHRLQALVRTMSPLELLAIYGETEQEAG